MLRLEGCPGTASPCFRSFPQGSGRWAKKVRGKLHFFGKVADDPKGEIAPRTFGDYKTVTDRLVAQFGKSRLVSDLATDDFESLRSSIAKCRGPVALGNEIQRVRSVFKYGYDAALIEHPVRLGPGFKRPSKKTLRLARAAKGIKMFAADDVKRIVCEADMQLKALVLLGINCGFGNSD